MKKRILFAAQIALLILFTVSFLATVFQFLGSSNPLSKFDHNDAVYNRIEAFDPALARLSTLKKLEQYCDSIYAQKVFAGGHDDFAATYTDIVSTAVRSRFFHGYSYYGYADNYVGALAAKISIPGLSALVIPDEILKHPYAACSQQSIVMMEVLKNRGISTRKISFQGKVYGGHFAFEVFYDGGWHYHDPNMEPDKAVLNQYQRPGIAFLVEHKDVLLKAYGRYPTAEVMDIYPTYAYGPIDKFPAPKAIIFQRITIFLSYSIWLFFLVAFLLVRRAYRRIGKIIVYDNVFPMRTIQPGMASAYYPGA